MKATVTPGVTLDVTPPFALTPAVAAVGEAPTEVIEEEIGTGGAAGVAGKGFCGIGRKTGTVRGCNEVDVVVDVAAKGEDVDAEREEMAGTVALEEDEVMAELGNEGRIRELAAEEGPTGDDATSNDDDDDDDDADEEEEGTNASMVNGAFVAAEVEGKALDAAARVVARVGVRVVARVVERS